MQKKPLKRLPPKPKRTGWRKAVHGWVVFNVLALVALIMFLGCLFLLIWLVSPGAF